ncbi:MAG: ATP-binding protein [Jatrophihabitantaceae bacterium]
MTASSPAEERARLAQLLNDVAVKRIAAISLRLDAATALTTETAPRRRIVETVADLNSVVDELRTTVLQLQRPEGAAEDLRGQVTTLAIAAATRLGCTPQLSFDGPLDELDDALTAEVLTGIDEALANVVRHSYAGTFEVRLDVTDQAVSFEVRDDGVGPNDEPTTGHGLADLGARADARGGTFTMEPNDGFGSVARWIVPRAR